MLKIDRDAKRFVRLPQQKLSAADLTERYDIQRMIFQSPQEFFAELGEALLLLGEEVRPAEFVDDRIDLLAIDQRGAAVIIELKRGSHKLQLLQALAYAGMVAQWPAERIVRERSGVAGITPEAAEDEIEEFLLEDAEKINQSQRIILIAEDFDFEVLVTAEWLNEKYGVDIRCYRLVLSADGESEYLNCTCIYPPPELSEHAIRRGGRADPKPSKWDDWDAALRQVENPAIVAYFKRELAAGRDNYLRKRIIRYRVGGRRRWWVAAHQKAAYVWQTGRFSGDEEFWRGRVSAADEVKPVKGGTCLRLFLSTAEDFERFSKAVTSELSGVAFLSADGSDEEAPE